MTQGAFKDFPFSGNIRPMWEKHGKPLNTYPDYEVYGLFGPWEIYMSETTGNGENGYGNGTVRRLFVDEFCPREVDLVLVSDGQELTAFSLHPSDLEDRHKGETDGVHFPVALLHHEKYGDLSQYNRLCLINGGNHGKVRVFGRVRVGSYPVADPDAEAPISL